ncbi:MAG: hypothetical protein KatS3mg058_1387 [Roseiflexus sp.]|jgi:hypothetical protein|nr:MAG: hypothetical protein KatS3mg058_1387 [Roseiflexus sp.]
MFVLIAVALLSYRLRLSHSPGSLLVPADVEAETA